jgi:two-component system sensor histidine kinase BaeS
MRLGLRGKLVAAAALVMLLAFAAIFFFTVRTEVRELMVREVHAGGREVVQTATARLPARRMPFDERFLIIVLGVGTVAIGGMLLLAGRIVRPIQALTLAMGSATTTRVAVRSNDEVGDLARSFNALVDRLERSERDRQQLISDVAHELRTPLTNIRAAVESLQDGIDAPTPAALASVHDEVLLLQRLVADLHELSLADTAPLTLEIGVADICTEAGNAVAAFAERFAARRIDLRVEPAANVPHVACDRRRVRQVMHNLLANALRYTGEDGSVIVRIAREDAVVRVSVCDDGIGFPSHEAQAIFERFYRVDPSRSRETGGSGLGLAIARQLIEAQGGTIGAIAAEPRGAIVWFTLSVA